MRAVVYDRYGPPELLRVEDVPMPSPAANQVLLRVVAHADQPVGLGVPAGRTAVCAAGWSPCAGAPDARLGCRRPGRGSRLGGHRFRAGDEVYGDNLQLKGGFAEYAVAPESVLAPKRAALTFAEASTIPQAAAIALQGTAGVAPGQRVLINGAGGGSGCFAIQLAKRAGAHVTGVDNAGKLDFMRSLGADDVIDYRSEDFIRTDEPYDLVLDLVAHRSPFACRRALASGGRYRCVGGPVPILLGIVTVGSIIGRLSRRRLGVLVVRPGPAHFSPLTDLVSPATSASTSTARSRSTKCRKRCGTSARDTPTARSSSRPTKRRPVDRPPPSTPSMSRGSPLCGMSTVVGGLVALRHGRWR